MCVDLVPDVFALDTKRKAFVIDADAAPVELLIEAAENCPCSAIIVEDDDGNALVK